MVLNKKREIKLNKVSHQMEQMHTGEDRHLYHLFAYNVVPFVLYEYQQQQENMMKNQKKKNSKKHTKQ